MTLRLRRKPRTTPRRSIPPAIIREYQNRRAARGPTVVYAARREGIDGRTLLISCLWGALITLFVLLFFTPLAHAATLSPEAASTSQWRAKSASRPIVDSAVIPVAWSTSSQNAPALSPDRPTNGSATTESTPGAALRWRSPFIPRAVAPDEEATGDEVTPVGYQEPEVSRSRGEWTAAGQGPRLPIPAMPISTPVEARPIQLPGRIDPSSPNIPSLEDAMAMAGVDLIVDCEKERAKLKPIGSITHKIAAEPGEFPPECRLEDLPYQARGFGPMVWTWKATGLCHKPLYFEEPRLERYGHSLPPIIQPVASAAHFFVSVPLLPYKMGLEQPNECVYSLGYYRPGSCAPYHLPGIPFSVRGAVYQAGLVGGLFLVH